MRLDELLNNIKITETAGSRDREVAALAFDSRKVTMGALYVAVKGSAADGHSYISSAVERGAVAVVCEEFPAELAPDVTYIKVGDSSRALGQMASNFYGNPSEKLKLIGITGTNGKTSSTTLLFDIFKNLDFRCALISTVEYRIADEVIPSTHTTPDVLRLNEMLAKAVAEGCEFAFMEVSSHGIHQNRTEGLKFHIAGFTNITHDHLDYHPSSANIWR